MRAASNGIRVGGAPSAPVEMRTVQRAGRPAPMGPVAPSSASTGALPTGLPGSLLGGWQLSTSTARVAPAAPAAVVAAPAKVHVAPLIMGMVRVNPLAIANSPSLFSSSELAEEGERDAA